MAKTLDNTMPSGPGKPEPKPLSVRERSTWNHFLHFLYGRGMAGAPVLDDRSRELGKHLMGEYNASNPADTLSYDLVPRVQADFQYLKDHGYFPGEDSSARFSTPMIRGVTAGKIFSPVDSWLGSLTSMQAYPVAISPDGRRFGTDYKGFDAYVSQYLQKTGAHVVDTAPAADATVINQHQP